MGHGGYRILEPEYGPVGRLVNIPWEAIPADDATGEILPGAQAEEEPTERRLKKRRVCIDPAKR